MPYKGILKDIRIPEETYYRYMALKGRNSHRETLNAMINTMELIKKIWNFDSKDAVTIEKKFRELAEREGVL